MSMTQYTVFLAIAPFAAIISAVVAFYCWKHRAERGATYLALALLAVAGYVIINTLELVIPTVGGTLLFARMAYPIISLITLGWLAFTLDYVGKQEFLALRFFGWLWIIPLVTTLLVFTNERHHLIWQTYEFVPFNNLLSMRVLTYGFWFRIFVIYSYIILFIGVFLVVGEYVLADRVYRRQSLWIAIGALLPLLGNVIYIFRLIPDFRKDYSPISYALGGIFFAIGIFKYRLFDLMPVAWAKVIENMRDGIVVFDLEGRIVDFNPAARRVLEGAGDLVIGEPLALFTSFLDQMIVSKTKDHFESEYTVTVDQKIKSLNVHITCLRNQRKAIIGYLVDIYDITEYKTLLQATQKLAIVDSLTELVNRRHFIDLAQEEAERSRNNRDHFSLIMIDIDNLKKINDTFGHLKGDQALRVFAKTLSQTVRSRDIVGRIGGDEFIILLSDSDKQAAEKFARRLCQRISTRRINSENNCIKITASMGIATFSGEGDLTLDDLMERADKALYQAKRQGRNQVCVFTATPG
jgi:diguanylate cyclase (GGDEF)-like protein/PAS domain S-box-containing protein